MNSRLITLIWLTIVLCLLLGDAPVQSSFSQSPVFLPVVMNAANAAAWRSSDTRLYPWGNQSLDCWRLSYSSDCPHQCAGDSATVGSCPDGARSCGALDLAGDLMEWDADCCGDTCYAVCPLSQPNVPLDGAYKVLCGGSWLSNLGCIRLAPGCGNIQPQSREGAVGFSHASIAPGQ